MPAGRPSKYKPEYCEQLVEWMRGGNSFTSFGSVVNSAEETLINWAAQFPEFFNARKMGQVALAKYYENMGKALATGQLRRVKSEKVRTYRDKEGIEHPMVDPQTKELVYDREYEPISGNSTAWIFLCKNMLGWRDKKDIELSGKEGGPINFADMSDSQIKKEIDDIVEKLKNRK